ncbi:MAG: methyltransferase domain-containing protein, partial [Deltaproteobacteria bacterium]|nr:methyltransferase domain-containing protein [Deltaproteobacteria bacterium]
QRITVVPNGVDSTLFAPASARLRRENPLLLYSSRPERGLEHLVGWGTDGVAEEGGGEPGIMELLARELPELTLGVCAYDNTTPALAETYARLARRCTELPNVRWLGALSKSALGAHMSRAWLHIYPTTFEEVSCITAMETQCAGTPILTTPVAALPETLKGAGVTWVPLTPGGAVDRPAFARAIAELWRDESRWEALHRTALAKAPELGWNRAADAVEAVVAQVLSHQVSRPARLARHLLRMSDILPLQTWLEGKMPDLPAPRDPGTPEPQDTRSPLRGSGGEDAALLVSVREELDACYGFAREGDFFQHYRDYYAYERKRGVSYGPENLIGNPRYEVVSQALEDLPSGAVVLDLGCAHGHYTMNLARRFPHLNWIGMDLVAENIATARAWAESEGRTNVRFLHGTLESPPEALPPLDAVLAAEVLEHVTEPWALVDGLAQHLKPGGRMVLTTPYGPWESQGYREHWPWRAHLHHLEGEDLREAFGHHPEFRMIPVPAGSSAQGEPLGSYVTRFGCPRRPSRRPDWTRKLRQQKPRETLSVCMLTRPEGDTLARTLKSVASVADEIILGVDVGRLPDGAVPPEALGRAASIGAEFGARVFPLESPLHSGFDAARNATLARAGGDWVLWIDDDEELLWPERLPKYLRDNGYDAYALAQHHFAVEPGGLLKTDYPCRLFRNRRGFQFFGLVHEHPELGFNQGPGRVLVLGDLALCHNGYATEEVRRGRFQ